MSGTDKSDSDRKQPITHGFLFIYAMTSLVPSHLRQQYIFILTDVPYLRPFVSSAYHLSCPVVSHRSHQIAKGIWQELFPCFVIALSRE